MTKPLKEFLNVLMDKQGRASLSPRMILLVEDARAQCAQLDRRIAAFDAEFVRWAKENEEAHRLTTIPWIGAIVAISKSPFLFVFWRQPASGNEPVLEWLQGLDKENRREMGFAMHTVQFGWPLGMPLCRPMGDGLHELRVSLKGRQEARLLFCVHNETIVGLRAFFKTTPTTPNGDLELAKLRMRAMQ